MTILHTLRCIGFVTPSRLIDVTGLAQPDIESELIDLAVSGLVTRDQGAWGLTEAGKAADARNVAKELAKAGTRAELTAAYERFLPLNKEMLDICTAWQLRPGAGVLDHLAEFHQRADVVCARFSAALPRFERYRTRLDTAVDMVRRGFSQYVTDDFDSYHIVWFQLHEDLLATLGIPR